MDHIISRLDLNLLKVLMVLLEVQNTRIAADKLNLSQPAVSRALARLRQHLDDPLFVRSNYGMTPTPKALELGEKITPVMQELTNALTSDTLFNPSELTGRIVIAVNGFIAGAFAPRLSELVLKEASGVELIIANWDKHSAQNLVDGELDLGINYASDKLSKQLYQRSLFEDDFVLVVRRHHPLAMSQNGIEEVTQMDVISLVINDWNAHKALISKAVNPLGITVNVRMRSHSLSTILGVIQTSDLIFPCSQSMASSLGDNYQIITIPESSSLPNKDVVSIVASKNRQQPVYRWLMQLVQQSI